ncbi:MAG: hypothetical protein J7502_10530 [Flavisolibacter sp.]|nr:hypothetical protein [Flavisolibacter sp.]
MPFASSASFKGSCFRRCVAGYYSLPQDIRPVSNVLKNAIDVGSRPYRRNAWAGKSGAVVRAQSVPQGGFVLIIICTSRWFFVDVPMMQQREAYIENAPSLLDEGGNLVPAIKSFLQTFPDAYETCVSKFLKNTKL